MKCSNATHPSPLLIASEPPFGRFCKNLERYSLLQGLINLRKLYSFNIVFTQIAPEPPFGSYCKPSARKRVNALPGGFRMNSAQNGYQTNDPIRFSTFFELRFQQLRNAFPETRSGNVSETLRNAFPRFQILETRSSTAKQKDKRSKRSTGENTT